MLIEGLNKNIQRVLGYILYLFIVLFPFLTYKSFLYYDTSTRAINLIILVEIFFLVLAVYLFKKGCRLSVVKSPITLILVLFIGILFVSSLLGVDYVTSFWSNITRTTGLFYFIHLLFFYFILFMFLGQEGKIKNFIRFFLFSAGIFSIGALIDKNSPGFTFGNSTFAGMYLYSAFILSLYYVFAYGFELRWGKYFLPLVFIINPYFVNSAFWTGKVDLFNNPLEFIGSAKTFFYTTILSLLLLLVIWLVSRIKNILFQKRVIWSLVVVGLVFSFSSVVSLLSPSGFLHKLYLSQSSNARPIVWDLAKLSIAERPFWGWGVDNFAKAFEANYNSELLEQKNGGEGWFDRAHNIFIDQTVETGYIGLVFYLLIYLTLIGCLLFVLFKSNSKNNRLLAVFLMVYFIGHIVELQTAFDTAISYVSLIVMISLSAVIFQQTIQESSERWRVCVFTLPSQFIFGGLLLAFFIYSLLFGTIPFVRSQIANGEIRTIGSSEKRLSLYPVLLNSPVNKSALIWRSAYDLQRGISLDPTIILKKERSDGFIAEFDILTKEFENYLLINDTDYRAHLELSNIYIYQSLFEVNNLDKAHQVLDRAISLVSQAPQAYWLKSVAYLYQRNFPLAKEFAQKAYDLNPRVEESQRLVKYIDESVKTLPEIDLYVFRQI